MTEPHGADKPKALLMRQIPMWMRDLVPSPAPIDRAIDGAILGFVIFSVLSITIAQASLLTGLALWTYKLQRAKARQTLHLPLLVPILAFLLASIIATATAVDLVRSVKELRNVFQPALFFLVVNQARSEDHAIKLSHILIVVGAATAVLGLSQSITHGAAFRIRGTMSIWMTFAGLLMLIATVALAHILFSPHGRPAYWLVAPLILLVAALVMTQTRGAWLGFAGGAVLILGARKRLLLLALPLIAVAIFVMAPHAVQERVHSFVNPQDVTAKERLYMWESGLRMIRDYPWTGVGPNGVKTAYPAYRDPRASPAHWGHLHNNIMQIAVERGLIGLACWLWIWIAFYRDVWRRYRRLGNDAASSKALVVGSLAAVTAFHIQGLSQFTFGDSEVIMLVYFLMALPYLAASAHTTSGPPPRA